MKITAYGHSDIGLVRQKNEDNFLSDTVHNVYAVADGLGGLPEGALASKLAIDCLNLHIKRSNGSGLDMSKVFPDINERVSKAGQAISSDIGIGTTLTVVSLREKMATIGHVGDSAVFLIRNGKISQLTTDHTMEQEMRALMMPGEEKEIPEYFMHTLTRCIGQIGDLKTDVTSKTVRKGDKLLICSDGISKVVEENELLLEAMNATDPETFVRRIIQRAADHGGPDNATGVAVFVS